MLLQRCATGILSHQVWHVLPFRDRVNGKNKIIHDGGGLTFPCKSFASHSGCSQMWQQHLDCDEAIQPRIKRFEDDSHPASANDADDFVFRNASDFIRIVRRPQQR